MLQLQQVQQQQCDIPPTLTVETQTNLTNEVILSGSASFALNEGNNMAHDEREWISKGKDADPEQTVARILGILQKAGIETEYRLLPGSVDICYAARVTVKGPLGRYLGANGKGLSPALCKASAYGELMERLQNYMFAASPLNCDPNITVLSAISHGKYYYVRGTDQPACIRALKDRLASSAPASLPGFARADLVDTMLEELAPKATPGRFNTRPFFSLRQKKWIDLPYELIELFTLSNGMAAGNTLEEAIVQGCSEIFERYCELHLLRNMVVPPDIPSSVIAGIPTVSHIIQSIEADGRYHVIVKDCSLGKGLPVVCGIICDRQRQTFGVKFGAHPSLRVALERVFSEALQGYTLEAFASNGRPLFANTPPSRVNNWNLIKTGVGSFPANLLLQDAHYPFVPWEETDGKTNRVLMKTMFALLEDLGADVYVAVTSYLDFPAVMIYAAGISETVPLDILHLKELKLRYDVQHAFHFGDSLSEEQLQKAALLAKVKRFSSLENDFTYLSGLYFPEGIPGRPDEAGFLEAVCLYALGRPDQAAQVLAPVAEKLRDQTSSEAVIFRLAASVPEAVKEGRTMEETRQVLSHIASPQVAESLLHAFSEPSKTPERLYPKCPEFKCETCPHKECVYPALFSFFRYLTELEMANPVDLTDLEELLS